jgi:adenine phosphoribosyltransferase
MRCARGGVRSPPNMTALKHCPCLIFNNDKTGDEAVVDFAEQHLKPFLHEDLQRLGDIVRTIPNLPRPGIDFRHVLGIAQHPGGLTLCTSLLQSHFTGTWSQIDTTVSHGIGGLVFASAPASYVEILLVPIREAGKLPPPTISVLKRSSYISSLGRSGSKKREMIEMGRDAVGKEAKVVVVDDVLSTGETLCAVLQLLGEAGIPLESISVMLVAEFPVYRGRELLCRRGFGSVHVQSLLVFGGR